MSKYDGMTLQEKMRAIKEERDSNKKDFGPKVDYFKPERGENIIRIIPDAKDPVNGLPYRDVLLHYVPVRKNDGEWTKGIPMRCRTEFKDKNGKPKTCVICEQYKIQVKRNKDKAGDLRVREGHIYRFADYKNKRIAPYIAGPQIHDQIIALLCDWKKLVALKGGHDIKLVSVYDAKKKFKYEYKLHPMPDATDLPIKLVKLLDAEDTVDIYSLFETDEKEKFEAFISEFFGVGAGAGRDDDEDDEDEDEEDEEDTRVSSAVSRAKAASKAAMERARRDEEDEDEEEEDEEDEDEDEVPAPKSSKSKPKSKPAPRHEEDDEDEEEEERPAPKSKPKSKPAPVEDDEEDEEEERPAPKTSKKVKPKSKSKVVDDDDEGGLEVDDDIKNELRKQGMEVDDDE